MLDVLANKSGLEGVSGAGSDLRDIEAAAEAGNPRAQLALDVFINSTRHYLGAYLVELGGADAIVFTGGIGENSVRIRNGVCRDLDWFGIALDPASQRGRGQPNARLGRRVPRRGLDRADQRGTRRRPTVQRPAAIGPEFDRLNKNLRRSCSWPR